MEFTPLVLILPLLVTVTSRALEPLTPPPRVAELVAIAAALERLDLGTYGQCTDCGGAIASLRLQALPEAARCIACQERAEQLPPFARA
jgi:DnaK suppressor protein